MTMKRRALHQNDLPFNSQMMRTLVQRQRHPLLLVDEVIGGGERSVAVVIGPEGGFTEDEVAAVREAGYECVTIGKRILRAETAAIAAAAVVMQLCGEWK